MCFQNIIKAAWINNNGASFSTLIRISKPFLTPFEIFACFKRTLNLTHPANVFLQQEFLNLIASVITLPPLQSWKYKIDMERGSYARLDRIDNIQIELNEKSQVSLEDDPSELHKRNKTYEKHVDYVLVYETPKDVSGMDDDALAKQRKLVAWRYSFEKCLENKLGLDLQRKTVIIGEVNNYRLEILLLLFHFITFSIYLEAYKAMF